MSGILQTALSNAMLVTAAVPVVWAVGRVARRPALTHALWLIVLVKLLTPPLWTVAVQLPHAHSLSDSSAGGRAVVIPPDVVVDHHAQVATAEVYQFVTESPTETRIPTPAPTPVPAPFSPPAVVPIAPRTVPWRPVIIRFLEMIWLAGSAGCLVVALVRMIRFSRALRFARPAPPGVQARADELARRLRLRAAPKVCFIPGALCPMLWTAGSSARLLVPSALWQRLDEIQRDAVLLHELAHWVRRDHWVRWIELIATTTYWWLPPCWLARRELREAEEHCCDAWVLWALPGKFRNYANALLEAVEFISIRADRPSALNAVPALASGMGQFRHLKRRLAMLKNGNVSRVLSWGGLAAALGLGALFLPISPILAQTAEESPKNPVAVTEQTTPVPIDSKPATESSSSQSTTTKTVEDSRINDSRINDVVAKLAASQRQIEILTRRLEEANATIAVMKAGSQQQRSGDPNGTVELAPGHLQSFDTEVTVEAGKGLPELAEGSADPTAAKGGNDPFDQNKRLVVRDRRTGRIKTIIVGAAGGGIGMRTPEVAGPMAQAERLDRLEANLRAMLQEIKSIRAESGARNAEPQPVPEPARR